MLSREEMLTQGNESAKARRRGGRWVGKKQRGGGEVEREKEGEGGRRKEVGG